METSIIIPAHNEQDNLPKLVDGVLKLKGLGQFETILVNDNSTDKTKEIVDRYARKYKSIKAVHRGKGKNGMGSALKEGTNIAKGHFIVWLMGDNSDDLATIPKFIEQLRSTNADIVFGSRYIKGGSSGNLHAYKVMLSKNYTRIIQILFGVKVHDVTNAFRAFKKEVYNQIKLKADDFSISPEFAIKAHLKGFRLKEVPTTYKDRQAGKPKFKILKMGITYFKLFKYRFIPVNK